MFAFFRSGHSIETKHRLWVCEMAEPVLSLCHSNRYRWLCRNYRSPPIIYCNCRTDATAHTSHVYYHKRQIRANKLSWLYLKSSAHYEFSLPSARLINQTTCSIANLFACLPALLSSYCLFTFVLFVFIIMN